MEDFVTTPGRMARARAILDHIPENVLLDAAEIGVAAGLLSSILLKSRPLLTLYMVDLWAHNPSMAYRATGDPHSRDRGAPKWADLFRQARRNTRHAVARARLVRLDSVAASKRVNDRSLDLVFIDDDHSREGCTRSIRAWFYKAKPGGWIGGHDYKHTSRRFHFGVKEAVHDFFDPRGLVVKTGANFTWFVRIP